MLVQGLVHVAAADTTETRLSVQESLMVVMLQSMAVNAYALSSLKWCHGSHLAGLRQSLGRLQHVCKQSNHLG